MLKQRLRKYGSWLHIPYIYKTFKILQQAYEDLGYLASIDAEAKEEALLIIEYALDHREFSQLIPPVPTDLSYMASEASTHTTHLTEFDYIKKSYAH